MNKRRYASAALAVLLLLSLMLSLSSCFGAGDGVMPSKETLASNIDTENKNASNVTGYLEKWGFTPFNKNKMLALEELYAKEFYEQLPSKTKMAAEVANYFLEYFYDEIDLTSSAEVTDALIHCYVAATNDAYGVYRTADEYVEYNTDMSGTFVGIGISVQYINNQILVITVFDDSPALRAGIKEGDIIIKVDGESVEELGYEQAINNVRGEAGANVTITVVRDGRELDIVATRAPVTEMSVFYELSEELIGYIEITSFKGNTDEQFIEAIDYMEENGARAIIFDLRSNGGGYVDTVINMIDYLVPKGTQIVSFGSYTNLIKAENDHRISVPVAILTNAYSASASELFTAALRDYSSEEMGLMDCTVVGTTTFGKGVMQTTYKFTDRSSITLTVAYFYSPLGNNHNEVGIIPDIEVALGETGDSQYDRAYSELLSKIQK